MDFLNDLSEDQKDQLYKRLGQDALFYFISCNYDSYKQADFIKRLEFELRHIKGTGYKWDMSTGEKEK